MLYKIPKKKIYKFSLIFKLFKEAGKKFLINFFILTFLARIFEVLSLSIFLSLFLLDASKIRLSFISENNNIIFLLLAFIILIRGFAFALVKTSKEQLKNKFSNKLKNQLFPEILFAESKVLIQLDRNYLKESLSSYINNSAIAFDQSIKVLESAISLFIYITGVFYFGNKNVLPLIAGILATFSAALLWKNNSWNLGQIKLKYTALVAKIMSEGIYGIKTIRASNAQNWIINKYKINNKKVLEIQKEFTKREAFYSALKDFLILSFMLIWFKLNNNEIERSYIFLIILLSYKSSSFFNNIITSYRLTISNLSGFDKLLEIKEKLKITEKIKNNYFSKINQKIEINKFEWISNEDKLSPFGNIKLKKGDILVLKGNSGSGKSTLIDILSGNLCEQYSKWTITSSDQGHVYVFENLKGARDIKKYIGYSPQLPYMFESSFLENLLLDNPKSNFENLTIKKNIETLLKKTNLHNRFKNFSMNELMNLTIDNFSGGEKKRIALIRTWLRDCPIEFLDEPTESLDDENIQKILSIILERSERKITIISSHCSEIFKLSTKIIDLTKLKGLNLKSFYKNL